MVRLGFLGCGFMGQGVHLRNFLATGKCQAVALAETRPRLAAAVAQRYGIAKVYASEMELALDPNVDAVVAITSEVLHRHFAPTLLHAGKHLFIEKPLSTSLASAQEIVRAGQQGNAMLMVAYMKRCDPNVERARKIISDALADGSLGALTFATAIDLGGDWIAGYQADNITTDEKAPGADPVYAEWLPKGLREPLRIFNNVFCHDINILRFLLQAKEWGIDSARYDGKTWSLLMTLGNIPVVLNAGGWAGPWYEQTVIHFQKGRVEITFPAPLDQQRASEVRLVRGSGQEEFFDGRAGYRGWPFYREAEHFLECVEQGKQPVSSGADSAIDLEIVEEVFRHLSA
jgi:predicted dehydrogenase